MSWPAGGDDGGDDVPVEVADTATSLLQVSGRPVDRVDLLVAFLDHLDERYGQTIESGPGPLQAEWRRRATTLGCPVRVLLPSAEVEGIAVDITTEGHLVVETAPGERRTFAVGDVVHLR